MEEEKKKKRKRNTRYPNPNIEFKDEIYQNSTESWRLGSRDPVRASFWSRRRPERCTRFSPRLLRPRLDGFCVGHVSREPLPRERSLKVNGFLADASIATSPGGYGLSRSDSLAVRNASRDFRRWLYSLLIFLYFFSFFFPLFFFVFVLVSVKNTRYSSVGMIRLIGRMLWLFEVECSMTWSVQNRLGWPWIFEIFTRIRRKVFYICFFFFFFFYYSCRFLLFEL